MPNRLTRTRVDNLGERLRTGKSSTDDLDLLDAYRESFESAYRQVVNTTRQSASAAPSGRPGKSTASIIDKLSRETVRLTAARAWLGRHRGCDCGGIRTQRMGRPRTSRKPAQARSAAALLSPNLRRERLGLDDPRRSTCWSVSHQGETA